MPNYRLILITLISGLAFADKENELMPTEVSAFIEKRDSCDHFRGEYPYDEERRVFLEKNILALCTGSDAELAKLKSKFSNDPTIIAKLNEYEVKIESSQGN